MNATIELGEATAAGYGHLADMMFKACHSYLRDNSDIRELSHAGIVRCLREDVLDFDNWDDVCAHIRRFRRLAHAVAITIADELKG